MVLPIVSLVGLALLAFLLHEVRKAPFGYEDGAGFHVMNTPDRDPVRFGGGAAAIYTRRSGTTDADVAHSGVIGTPRGIGAA